MAKGNRFKESEEIEKPEKAEKPERKSSSVERKKKTNKVSSFISFFKDERFHQISGLLFILFSVFFCIAFASYFFTWQNDHDKVMGPWMDLIRNSDIKVDNWLGKMGAIVSHQFIYNWFGVASFFFVMMSFLIGFKFLFKIELLPFGKTIKHAMFNLIGISTALAFIFKTKSKLLFLGGATGFEIQDWISSQIGNIGTGFLLAFALTSYLALTFRYTFKLPVNINAPQDIPLGKEKEVVIAPVAETKQPLFEAIIDDSFKTQAPEINLELNSEEEEEVEELEEDTQEIEMEVEEDEEQEEENSGELILETSIPESEIVALTGDGVPLSLESIDAAHNAELDQIKIPSYEELGEYDPTLDLSSYQFPTLDLLENYQPKNKLSHEELMAELEGNKNRIVETLGHYNIGIDKIKATVGPTVTLFEIVPQAGIRISKIKNLEDDIALSLSALGIRIIAPIPGKGTIGIEVPNQNPEIVSMRSIIASEKFQNSEFDLPIGLGKTISNEVFVTDLTKMPHLLMAGATGQGKSVGLNAVLASLLYKKHPSQVKFVLVDPKKVELTLFKTIERHFLAKLPGEEEAIITDTKKVVNTLNSLCIEMDQRYELLKDAQVRNIREYNAKFVNRRLNPNNGHRYLPFIVLVVDEFADLIMTAGKEVEAPIARLAQLARAIGIHLIIATQRPSVNIITGTIKANFPARIAFRVTSKIDSRTILDTGGADQLIGRGDMLLSTGADLIRLQCAFVDTPEIDKITGYIGSQRGYSDAFLLPEYVGDTETAAGEIDASDRDPLFEEAARLVVQHQQGSASLLQRRLKLGYNRAGRLIDQLEAAGIIGPFEGSKAREVRCKDPMSLEQILGSHV